MESFYVLFNLFLASKAKTNMSLFIACLMVFLIIPDAFTCHEMELYAGYAG